MSDNFPSPPGFPSVQHVVRTIIVKASVAPHEIGDQSCQDNNFVNRMRCLMVTLHYSTVQYSTVQSLMVTINVLYTDTIRGAATLSLQTIHSFACINIFLKLAIRLIGIR